MITISLIKMIYMAVIYLAIFLFVRWLYRKGKSNYKRHLVAKETLKRNVRYK